MGIFNLIFAGFIGLLVAGPPKIYGEWNWPSVVTTAVIYFILEAIRRAIQSKKRNDVERTDSETRGKTTADIAADTRKTWPSPDARCVSEDGEKNDSRIPEPSMDTAPAPTALLGDRRLPVESTIDRKEEMSPNPPVLENSQSAGGATVSSSDSPSENDSPDQSSSKHRKFFITVVLGTIFAGIAYTIYLTSREPVDPAGTDVTSQIEFDQPQLSRFRLWDSKDCERTYFPALEIPENTDITFDLSDGTRATIDTANRGWITGVIGAKLFCSRQWDPTVINDNLGVLQEHNILPLQWGDPNLPAEFADIFQIVSAETHTQFLFLVQSLPLVYGLTEPGLSDSFEAMINTLPSRFRTPPSLKDFRAAAAKIDFGEIATLPVDLPREIVLTERNPRISLLTDLGWDVTLLDVARATLINFDFMEVVKARSSVFDVIEDTLEKNWPYSSADDISLIGYVQIITEFSLGKLENSQPGSRSRLSDLTILFTEQADVVCESHELDVSAVYCPSMSAIYVRRQSAKTGRSESAGLLEEITPQFYHEFAHYLHDREVTREVPFISEGEATAEGEIGRQAMVAALSLDVTQRREGIQQFEEVLVNPSEKTLEDSIRFFREKYNETPFTDLQREYICLLKNHGLNTSDVRQQLLKPPLLFYEQNAVELDLAYARAWILYHLVRLDAINEVDSSFSTSMDSVGLAIANNRSLDDEQWNFLDEAVGRANMWLQDTVVKREVSCARG